jgi:transposase
MPKSHASGDRPGGPARIGSVASNPGVHWRPWRRRGRREHHALASCSAPDHHGKSLLRKKFNRKQLIEFFAKFHACTVVMEACPGAHFMARQLAGFGHVVKLISPQFVRPFVKSNKNDFVDAEAICEAASRPSMRFVTLKNEAQQTLSPSDAG